MRFGLVAEGRSDLAVIVNVIKGALGLNSMEPFQFLLPEYNLDETDLHRPDAQKFSNWELVRQCCEDGATITAFMNSPLDEQRLLVVHIDAAEAELPGFDVVRPDRNHPDFPGELRCRIVAAIDGWLGPQAGDHVRYAVAIEETDAWVLALLVDKDTSRLPNVKERLERKINESYSESERRRLFQRPVYERYDELSRLLRKRRKLADAATRNTSLRSFVDSLPVPVQVEI